MHDGCFITRSVWNRLSRAPAEVDSEKRRQRMAKEPKKLDELFSRHLERHLFRGAMLDIASVLLQCGR